MTSLHVNVASVNAANAIIRTGHFGEIVFKLQVGQTIRALCYILLCKKNASK